MICMTNPSCLAGVICFIYLPVFDLLSVYVYIAIKVELLYYIYIYIHISLQLLKKRILQLQISLKNFFFFQSRCQCVLLTHFRYVTFAVLWRKKGFWCNFHRHGIPSKLCTIHDDFLWERVILCIFQMLMCDLLCKIYWYLIYLIYSHSCIIESIEDYPLKFTCTNTHTEHNIHIRKNTSLYIQSAYILTAPVKFW